MGNKPNTRIDTSGIADPFGHNPFGSLPLSGFSAPLPEAESAPGHNASDPEIADRRGLPLRVRREKKGRAGKTVTVIHGANSLPVEVASDLLGKLKKALACGGTVEDGCLILQGDKPDQVCSLLEEQGFKPIRSGG